MKPVGIEAMNVFGGTVCVDLKTLAEHRQLDTSRFENLLMKQKTVPLPQEDPVSYGVNAAQPVVEVLSAEERSRIEMVVTCTESSFDFGKSMSTYIHDLLGLNRNCRLFELKNACYSGTAGLQMAFSFILSQTSPGAKALVVATDVSRFMVVEGGDALTQDWSFAEPSSGAGAVAMLVSDTPYVFQADVGANGYYGYEVMDTCRPTPDAEAGDSDLSLMSYLTCCENAFLEYQKRVEGADYADSFDYLAFHTPFGGMVKGAHRNLMRKLVKAKPQEIEADFKSRVEPALNFCQRVGNIMGATLPLSLAGVIDGGRFDRPARIGCFSYGSGCCSEFFSGVVTSQGQSRLQRFEIGKHLDLRRILSMDEYETLLRSSDSVKFGTRNVVPPTDLVDGIQETYSPGRRLFLKEIHEYHRTYEWAG